MIDCGLDSHAASADIVADLPNAAARSVVAGLF